MPDELYYQRQIIKDFKQIWPNGYAMKMSHKMLGGIPDLMLKTPFHPLLMVEVKLIKEVPKSGRIKIAATPLQRKTMEDMAEAGINCQVWLVLENLGDWKGPFILTVHAQAEEVTVRVGPNHMPNMFSRPRGKLWPLMNMIPGK